MRSSTLLPVLCSPIFGSSKSPFGASNASARARSTREFPAGTNVNVAADASRRTAMPAIGTHTLVRAFMSVLIKSLQLQSELKAPGIDLGEGGGMVLLAR